MSGRSFGSRGYGSDAGGEALASMIILIVLVVLAILIWLLWKAVNLLVRVFVKYPTNKALWVALALCLTCWLAGGVTVATDVAGAAGPPHNTAEAFFVGVAVFMTAILLLVARVIELAGDDRLQPERESLVTAVLHRPWWTME